MKRWLIAVAALLMASVFGLVGCVAAQLPNVALAPNGSQATPPVLAAFGDDPLVVSAEEWTQRRAPLLRAAFEASVYGAWPEDGRGVVLARETLDERAFNGAGTIEQISVGLAGEDGLLMSVLLVRPVGAAGPLPLILTQNFCGNPAVFPNLEGVAEPRGGAPCGEGGWARPLAEAVFGSAIMTPPVERILAAGYAVAMMYAGEVAPDDAEAAEEPLAALTPTGMAANERTGAIAAWAWAFLRAMEAVGDLPEIDETQVALWGHSRNGKAALVAAAFDSRPAAVIALQAGTAGGSLQRNGVGESIAEITERYPHWFAPAYSGFAGREADLPVDQHQLLALIAPRPVLLGAARRDQWSDPHGAYFAAQGAADAYALLGAPRDRADDLRAPNFDHPLVTYMRGGLHGVHQEDWTVTLEFLKAWMPPG